jgi:hypothetical protein
MGRWTIWLAGVAVAFSLTSFMTQPAHSDELDTLALVKEAQPLRDRWEECAAAFVKSRLDSKREAERLAEDAFRNCRSREARLRSFVATKVGRQKADAVILLLRAQSLSDLTAAIQELRSRD